MFPMRNIECCDGHNSSQFVAACSGADKNFKGGAYEYGNIGKRSGRIKDVCATLCCYC